VVRFDGADLVVEAGAVLQQLRGGLRHVLTRQRLDDPCNVDLRQPRDWRTAAVHDALLSR
jgi:hypothetical protein